jgi:hypothetical protein
MLGWADQNWLRMVAYLAVAGLALLAARREPADRVATWRPFWPLTASIFVVMALGRAGGLAEWVIGQFRGEAYEAGWYDERRPLQAAVVMRAAWSGLRSSYHPASYASPRNCPMTHSARPLSSSLSEVRGSCRWRLPAGGSRSDGADTSRCR